MKEVTLALVIIAGLVAASSVAPDHKAKPLPYHTRQK